MDQMQVEDLSFMKGMFYLVVQNRRLQYKFWIRRNITIIKGQSATGKTTLIEMIQEYNDNGAASGVSIQSDVDCVVLSGRFWKEELSVIRHSIVFLDEGNRFVTSEDFAQAIRGTDNYYVIVTRERLENIPYSVEEIYGIRNSGKYGALKKSYHEFYRLYEEEDFNKPIKCGCVLTEDSQSGFQFFRDICQKKDWECYTAAGKSNIFASALKHLDKDVLIVADGAAFGPEMSRMVGLSKRFPNVHLFLPESFEWMILYAGVIPMPMNEEIFEHTSDCIDSARYFSWEQFFTAYLIALSHGTVWQYTKNRINPVYLQENVEKKILRLLPMVFIDGEEDA